MRFEHCYALDQTATSSTDARTECWREWLHGYTYGQSRDRIEYAATRFSQLSLGPTLPSEEVRDARPHRRVPTAAPVPTNAFAPPPNVAASAPPPSPPQPPPRPPERDGTRAPGSECADVCSQRWTSCREGCDGASAGAPKRGPGVDAKDRACAEQCDREYRVCMPTCFHEVPPAPTVPPPPRH